jgi:hypothetical protein
VDSLVFLGGEGWDWGLNSSLSWSYRKSFNLLSLSTMIVDGFSYMAFIMLRNFPSIRSLVSMFLFWKGIWLRWDLSAHHLRWSCVVFLLQVKMIYVIQFRGWCFCLWLQFSNESKKSNQFSMCSYCGGWVMSSKLFAC